MRTKASDQRKFRIITALIISVFLIIFIIFLIVYFVNDRKTVEVVPVSQVSTSYWENTTSAYGTVTNDMVQEIYPDDEKVLSTIFVSEGQNVNIGDAILQYDKEWLELDVERKTLEVEKKNNQIEMAQAQLQRLQNTTASVSGTSDPYTGYTPSPSYTPTPSSTYPTATPRPSSPTATPSPSTSTPTPSPTPTPIPDATVTVYKVIEANAVPYKGTGTPEDPYVFLCEPSYTIDPSFMRQLLGVDPYYTDPNDLSTGITAPFVAVFEVREGNSEQGKLLHSYKLNGIDFSGEVVDGDAVAATSTNTSSQVYGDDINLMIEYLLMDQSASLTYAQLDNATPEPTITPSPSPDSSANEEEDSSDLSSELDTATPIPEITNYDDMGYTAAELTEMISEKRDEIAMYQAERQQLQLDLDHANLALENSTVYSTVNGVVQSLIPLDEAKEESVPFLVISGSSEYYLSTALPETLLGKISVGDVLNAMSWETGNSYSCEIVSIDDNPITDGSIYFYGENPNSSQYECLAVIYDSDELRNNMYLDVTLTTDAANEDALYLEKMYVREDAGGSYVYKRRSSDGRLVKQYVNIGKTLDNWYIEILSDLTVDDYIVFPYGDVAPGMRTALDGEEDFLDVTDDNIIESSEGWTDDLDRDTDDGEASGDNEASVENELMAAYGLLEGGPP